MTYAKHIVGDQVRACRIKRRGPKNCRVIWLDSEEQQLVPRAELQECTAEEVGAQEPEVKVDESANESPSDAALTGDEVSRLMRNFQVTVKDLAAKLAVPIEKVREARQNGVDDPLVAFEWRQAICGEDHREDEQQQTTAA